MKSKQVQRLGMTLLVGVVIFITAIIVPKNIVSKGILSLITTQGLELGLALLAIVILGKGKFKEYGFQSLKKEKFTPKVLVNWIMVIIIALGMGAVANLVIALAGSGGNPLVKQLNFPQIILFIWIFSSIIEEVFVRGFIQSHLSPLKNIKLNLGILKFDLPTVIAAVFFGAMHLILLVNGVEFLSLVIILVFTFSLGLLAGYLRAKYESLIPAVIVHMLANMGGVIGGIIFVIITVITTGKPPVT